MAIRKVDFDLRQSTLARASAKEEVRHSDATAKPHWAVVAPLLSHPYGRLGSCPTRVRSDATASNFDNTVLRLRSGGEFYGGLLRSIGRLSDRHFRSVYFSATRCRPILQRKLPDQCVLSNK